ncbi:MAG: hypothetical protein KJS92_04365 [Bacteroidetes bacterium]|nr:hypothetical protein [Bacteroidota bacterium]
MKSILLKIDDEIFQETEQLLMKIKKPRNRYIKEALATYNKIKRKELLAAQLESESRLVAENSLHVLEDFEHTAADDGAEV